MSHKDLVGLIVFAIQRDLINWSVKQVIAAAEAANDQENKGGVDLPTYLEFQILDAYLDLHQLKISMGSLNYWINYYGNDIYHFYKL